MNQRRAMPRKEFVNLIEQNIMILDWLAGRLEHRDAEHAVFVQEATRQQLKILVRLYVGGKARLKDIAARELVPASNLCSAFRRMEQEGLVQREIDESDRRNTWYSVSPAGAQAAKEALDQFRESIAKLFSGISRQEEAELTEALRKLNESLTRIKENKM